MPIRYAPFVLSIFIGKTKVQEWCVLQYLDDVGGGVVVLQRLGGRASERQRLGEGGAEVGGELVGRRARRRGRGRRQVVQGRRRELDVLLETVDAREV